MASRATDHGGEQIVASLATDHGGEQIVASRATDHGNRDGDTAFSPWVQLLDKVVAMPVVVNDRAWRCRRCSSAVMDVAVITQRQLGSRAQWQCFKFCSSRRLRTFPLCNRDGYVFSWDMAVMSGIFGLFWPYFALLQVVWS